MSEQPTKRVCGDCEHYKEVQDLGEGFSPCHAPIPQWVINLKAAAMVLYGRPMILPDTPADDCKVFGARQKQFAPKRAPNGKSATDDNS